MYSTIPDAQHKAEIARVIPIPADAHAIITPQANIQSSPASQPTFKRPFSIRLPINPLTSVNVEEIPLSFGLEYAAGLAFLTDISSETATPETIRWRKRFFQHNGVCYQTVSDEAVESAMTKWL